MFLLSVWIFLLPTVLFIHFRGRGSTTLCIKVTQQSRNLWGVDGLHFQQTGLQLIMTVTLACGQVNREKLVFACPRSRLGLQSQEAKFSCPELHQPAHSLPRLRRKSGPYRSQFFFWLVRILLLAIITEEVSTDSHYCCNRYQSHISKTVIALLWLCCVMFRSIFPFEQQKRTRLKIVTFYTGLECSMTETGGCERQRSFPRAR